MQIDTRQDSRGGADGAAHGPPPAIAAAPHQDSRHERRIAWGWWFFAAAALFYLLSEHRAHFFGVLPYIFLLACPLMHLFMHHGHHRNRERQHDGEPRP